MSNFSNAPNQLEPTPSEAGIIRCAGPCRRRFRSEIVTSDRSIANALLTSDVAESGLFWFCRECRRPLVSAVRNPEDDDREDYLPPELWLAIFELLDGASILRTRLTCHRWREIVDGSRTLHGRFNVRLIMDRGYKPECLPPAANFSLHKVEILGVDSWWPSVGSGLTQLGIYDGKVALSTLLGMLKETPNLKVLTLDGVEYSSVEASPVDFQLERLVHLNCDKVLNVFGQMFPSLVELRVAPTSSFFNEEAVCHMIQSSQRTLKVLASYLTPSMLDRIVEMKQLKLITVHQYGKESLAVQLSRMQRSIKQLLIKSIAATNEELHEVGTNLPQLEQLNVPLMSSETTLTASFLAEMPRLMKLNLRGFDGKLLFGGPNNPLLKSLTIGEMQVAIEDMQNYLANCKNVEWLHLYCCKLSSWSDLFAMQFPSSMHSLYLSNNIVMNSSTTFRGQHNFSELHLVAIDDLTNETLIRLFLQCPRLENLSFRYVSTCSDETVAIVVSSLPALLELTIVSCPITDHAVEIIIANCGQLRRLDVSLCELISEAAGKRLQEFTRTL